MYILNMVDTSVSGFPMLFAGVLECVAVNYVYGKYFMIVLNFWLSSIDIFITKRKVHTLISSKWDGINMLL